MTKNLQYYLSLPYKTILEYEPDDNTWVAYCPELGRGSCYGIGDTQDEALSQLSEAKEVIISFALEENKEIPEPQFEKEDLPSGNFIVRLPKTLHKSLKYNADTEGVSLNQLVVSYLSAQLSKDTTLSNLENKLLNILQDYSSSHLSQFWSFGQTIIKSSVTEKKGGNPSIEFLNSLKISNEHLSGTLDVKTKETKKVFDFNARRIQKPAFQD
ncbi:toxin-antitoxin system HicB family antitoxin [Bacteroidota bacterium]